jgi:hypothetical protein
MYNIANEDVVENCNMIQLNKQFLRNKNDRISEA